MNLEDEDQIMVMDVSNNIMNELPDNIIDTASKTVIDPDNIASCSSKQRHIDEKMNTTEVGDNINQKIESSKVGENNCDNENDSDLSNDGAFYFESDHIALRGNPMYAKLLRTITNLESQSILLNKQIDTLSLLQSTYTKDPTLIVTKIKKGEEIIPKFCEKDIIIPNLAEFEEFVGNEPIIKEEEADISNETVANPAENKSITFNKPWTCEEQKRLEELLNEYPVESIESKRFAKIAKALGTRTLQQVSSRVQKYFQKLHSAGLPIPGRIPKTRRTGSVRSKLSSRPTTFFPNQMVPFAMPEDSDDYVHELPQLYSAPITYQTNTKTQLQGSYSTGDIMKYTDTLLPEQRKRVLYLLKTIQAEKHKNIEGYNSDPMATTCCNCNLIPRENSRWYCETCSLHLNLCTNCLLSLIAGRQFDHVLHNVCVDTDSR